LLEKGEWKVIEGKNYLDISIGGKEGRGMSSLGEGGSNCKRRGPASAEERSGALCPRGTIGGRGGVLAIGSGGKGTGKRPFVCNEKKKGKREIGLTNKTSVRKGTTASFLIISQEGKKRKRKETG